MILTKLLIKLVRYNGGGHDLQISLDVANKYLNPFPNKKFKTLPN